MSFWDTSGAELTAKGDGRYYYTEMENTGDRLRRLFFRGLYIRVCFDSYGMRITLTERLYRMNFIKMELVNGKSYDDDGKTYNYDSLETQAAFPGGLEELTGL